MMNTDRYDKNRQDFGHFFKFTQFYRLFTNIKIFWTNFKQKCYETARTKDQAGFPFAEYLTYTFVLFDLNFLSFTK